MLTIIFLHLVKWVFTDAGGESGPTGSFREQQDLVLLVGFYDTQFLRQFYSLQAGYCTAEFDLIWEQTDTLWYSL